IEFTPLLGFESTANTLRSLCVTQRGEVNLLPIDRGRILDYLERHFHARLSAKNRAENFVTGDDICQRGAQTDGVDRPFKRDQADRARGAAERFLLHSPLEFLLR